MRILKQVCSASIYGACVCRDTFKCLFLFDLSICWRRKKKRDDVDWRNHFGGRSPSLFRSFVQREEHYAAFFPGNQRGETPLHRWTSTMPVSRSATEENRLSIKSWRRKIFHHRIMNELERKKSFLLRARLSFSSIYRDWLKSQGQSLDDCFFSLFILTYLLAVVKGLTDAANWFKI